VITSPWLLAQASRTLAGRRSDRVLVRSAHLNAAELLTHSASFSQTNTKARHRWVVAQLWQAGLPPLHHQAAAV